MFVKIEFRVDFEFVFIFDQSSANLVTCRYDFAIDVVLMVDFILRLGEAEEGSLGPYGIEFPIFSSFWVYGLCSFRLRLLMYANCR